MFKTLKEAVDWLIGQGIDEAKAQEMAPALVIEEAEAGGEAAKVTPVPDTTPEAIAARINEKLDELEGRKATGYDEEVLSRMVEDQIAARDAAHRKAAEQLEPAHYAKVSMTDLKVVDTMEQLLVTPTEDHEVREFQLACDDLYILNSVLGSKARAENLPWGPSDWSKLKTFGRVHDMLAPGRTRLGKALYSTGAGVGDEWVPTGFSAQLTELFHLQYMVAALFESIPMPTNPYTLPVEASDATAYLATESQADESTKLRASTPETTSLTFTAVKLAARTVFSAEVEEDSIIPILPWVRLQVAKAIAFGVEDAILNGDSAGTHQDTNVTGSDDARKSWLGLRAAAIDGTSLTTSFSNAEPTLELLRDVRELLGTRAGDPGNLALIVSALEYIKLLGITQVLTLDQYGPAATVLTGELAKIDGIPIVTSEKMQDNLGASGYYDGVNTDRSSVILVHRPSWLLGERTGITVRSVEDIETDQTKMVSKIRQDYQAVFPVTTAANKVVALGYNIAT